MFQVKGVIKEARMLKVIGTNQVRTIGVFLQDRKKGEADGMDWSRYLFLESNNQNIKDLFAVTNCLICYLSKESSQITPVTSMP